MIDFSGYTREQIQKEMLSQVPKTIDTRQGSIIQTAVGPVAWYLEGIYMLLAKIQQNAYAETAVGQALDYICEERGIFRKQAVAAVRQGTFDRTIPEGSTFKTINGANSVIFTSGQQIAVLNRDEKTEYIYQLTCTTPGIIGNSYTGAILPITAIPGLTSAFIGEIIISGAEEEEDDSLRGRFMETFEAASFGGNIASYRNHILAIEGVGAVQVYPIWKGGGTVLCSILNSDLKPAETELIKQVQELVCPPEDGGSEPSENGYGIAPIGAQVTIGTAEELILNFSCEIQFSAGTEASAYQSQVEEKIQEYIQVVCEEWGAPLKTRKVEYPVAVYIARIIAAILTIPEAVNVSNVMINGSGKDLILTETAELQQIPKLGKVEINGS